MIVNATNNTLNFKAVYYENSELNKSQKRVASWILNEFRTPVLDKKQGTTYEILYERQGYNFLIKPFGNKDNVLLYANKIKGDSCCYNKDNFFIGNYNNRNPFNIQDVENNIQGKKSNERYYALATIAAIIAFVFMPIKGCINAIKGENIKKESPIITDTIKNSTNKVKSNILDLAGSIKNINSKRKS